MQHAGYQSAVSPTLFCSSRSVREVKGKKRKVASILHLKLPSQRAKPEPQTPFYFPFPAKEIASCPLSCVSREDITKEPKYVFLLFRRRSPLFPRKLSFVPSFGPPVTPPASIAKQRPPSAGIAAHFANHLLKTAKENGCEGKGAAELHLFPPAAADVSSPRVLFNSSIQDAAYVPKCLRRDCRNIHCLRRRLLPLLLQP